jgi:hypothetical protein
MVRDSPGPYGLFRESASACAKSGVASSTSPSNTAVERSRSLCLVATSYCAGDHHRNK